MSGDEAERLRIERVVYGGAGLARADGRTVLVPFTLPGELVEARGEELLRVVEASAERVTPGCPHFGVCGGCHLQMASDEEQLRIKREVLRESLERAGVREISEIEVHAAEAWGYRNRIRLHVTRVEGTLRLGYRRWKSDAVLPIVTCPIAAPVLWRTAEALMAVAARDADAAAWLSAASEVEIACDDAAERVLVNLLCRGETKDLRSGSFKRAMLALEKSEPALVGAGAVRVHPRTGQVQEAIAAWGAEGLSYAVGEERYWVARGGFFQVNRFLLRELVRLVCAGRAGALAWDLFAGVGLFSRVLARGFERVVGVEANQAAAKELQRALKQDAKQETTIDFLRRAVVERDRPELVVMDPPRAGAGTEVCELLMPVAPREVVYVSCDPVTLGRDLAVLQSAYSMHALHLVDLFPQTYHQEAVVVLRRRS